MEKKFVFDYTHYDSLTELPASDHDVVARARKATENAHAPYSNFHVGAAVKLKSGLILQGSNFESEVYPAGLCAERSLLFYVESNYASDPVEILAIASNPSGKECYPCGQCRQVIVDVERRQKHPIRVVMTSGSSATVVDRSTLLLPFLFELEQ